MINTYNYFKELNICQSDERRRKLATKFENSMPEEKLKELCEDEDIFLSSVLDFMYVELLTAVKGTEKVADNIHPTD